MSKRKMIQIDDYQFEYVNAVEIKELSAKYLVGQYVGNDKSIILRIMIDDNNYIIDASKRSELERDILSKYFMSNDGGEAFKEAIKNGDIISFYHSMPDVVQAHREAIDVDNKIQNEEKHKSPIISATKFEVPPAHYKIGEEKFLELKEINMLIINLQKELDRYHANMSRLENNDY